MLRSTGFAEEAACMVYLAISKLQGGRLGRGGGGGVEMVKGLGETVENKVGEWVR